MADNTVYNVPIYSQPDVDPVAERASHSNRLMRSIDGPRASARLEMSKIRKAQVVKARKPLPPAATGRMGVHKNARQPKPVETPAGYEERRLAGASQGMSLLHAAGIQRSTVELNSMKPLAKLTPSDGHWNLLQFGAAWADAATPVVISALPGFSADQEVAKNFDPACVAETITDGAIAARGRLIMRNESEERVQMQISSSSSVQEIFWSGRGFNPSAQSWAIDLAPHTINGETVEHMYFNDPPRVTMDTPREQFVEPGRIAMFDVLQIRAAANATTFAYISRMI